MYFCSNMNNSTFGYTTCNTCKNKMNSQNSDAFMTRELLYTFDFKFLQHVKF